MALNRCLPGGALTVELPGQISPDHHGEHGQDTVSLSIADTGCGIPLERLSTLFTDFQTTKRKGLGLGLAMVKKIVEELGGTLFVDSTVGQGTTVTVILKRAGRPATR